jgi:hypothetical protein
MRTVSRRPSAFARLAILLVLVAGLSGCMDQRQTDNVTDQAARVLREAGVPVSAIFLDVGIVASVDPSEADHTVHVRVLYDPDQTSAGLEAMTGKVADELWRKAIVQIDSVTVTTTEDPVAPQQEVTAAQLEQRLGPRPPDLVQVRAEALEKEQHELFGGLVALLVAGTILPILGFGLVVVTVIVVLVVVLTRRRNASPPPPPPPGWYGPGPAGPGR